MKLPLRLIRQRTSPQQVMLGTLTCLSIAIMAASSGCSYYGNALCSAVAPYEQIKCDGFTELRGRLRARAIWAKKYASCYKKHCYTADVREGFIDGFVDSCMGGDGCPPLFTPNGGCGLGLRSHSSAAWFEGYPLGAAAAEACGACRWVHNRCHPGLLACGATPTCNPGCEPCSGTGMCGSCGQAGSSCGCNGSGPIAIPMPTTMQPIIEDHDLSQDLNTSSPYDLPEVGPGETIVPGSFETLPSPPAPAEMEEVPATLPAPTPDNSAAMELPAEPTLVEKADVVQVQEPDQGIIQMVAPIQWTKETVVAPVSFKEN